MVSEPIAFVALSAVVICAPGPDTALTVRNAIVGRHAGGVWTAAGVATGQAGGRSPRASAWRTHYYAAHLLGAAPPAGNP